MNKTVTAPAAPAAIGPYCHAKLAGNTLYTSGQLGLDPATGSLREGVAAQTQQSLDNLNAVLTAAGFTFADVVKTTIFLADMDDFQTVNVLYAQYIQSQGCEPPARSCVAVKTLPKNGLVEIELVACH